jgi:hypothetical protein
MGGCAGEEGGGLVWHGGWEELTLLAGSLTREQLVMLRWTELLYDVMKQQKKMVRSHLLIQEGE